MRISLLVLPLALVAGPALGVEIDEQVAPALGDQPVAQRHRRRVVRARMTQEDARHTIIPCLRTTATLLDSGRIARCGAG